MVTDVKRELLDYYAGRQPPRRQCADTPGLDRRVKSRLSSCHRVTADSSRP